MINFSDDAALGRSLFMLALGSSYRRPLLYFVQILFGRAFNYLPREEHWIIQQTLNNSVLSCSSFINCQFIFFMPFSCYCQYTDVLKLIINGQINICSRYIGATLA